MQINPLRPRPGDSLVPAPLRAALGLVVSVVDDRQKLADRALELPVLAVSTALQVSLRAQQRYAALTAKGDEFLSQLRGAPESPPEWARFDDEVPFSEAPAADARDAADPDEDAPPASEPVAAVAELPRRKAATARKADTARKAATPRKRSATRAAATGRSAFDQVADHDDLPDLGFGASSRPEA